MVNITVLLHKFMLWIYLPHYMHFWLSLLSLDISKREDCLAIRKDNLRANVIKVI